MADYKAKKTKPGKIEKQPDGKLLLSDARVDLLVAAGVKQAAAEAIAKAIDMSLA